MNKVFGVNVFRKFEPTALSKRIAKLGTDQTFSKRRSFSELATYVDYKNVHINWSKSERLISIPVRAIDARIEKNGELLISRKPFYMTIKRAHKKVMAFLEKIEATLPKPKKVNKVKTEEHIVSLQAVMPQPVPQVAKSKTAAQIAN